MKTCSEMTSNVFFRIEQHKIVRKKRKKIITSVLVPITGVFIAVVAVMLFAPNKALKPMPDSVNSVIQSQTDKLKNKIIVNKIDSISLGKMYICLLCEDYVPMTKEEVNEYYGMDIFPEVPKDLMPWDRENDSAGFGIYRRDGGTGEVYHDTITLNYSNDDFTRNVNIEIAKGKLPFCCNGSFEEHCEKSIICGAEALIGQNEDGYYLIEMMYKDVGFRFIIEGLTIEEIEGIIESLVN